MGFWDSVGNQQVDPNTPRALPTFQGKPGTWGAPYTNGLPAGLAIPRMGDPLNHNVGPNKQGGGSTPHGNYKAPSENPASTITTGGNHPFAGAGGGMNGSGFLPRADPGYDLRPGQYGIDPNTAIVPHYTDWQNQLKQGGIAAGNRAPDGPFRNQQLTLADALMAQANGQGPSLAQSQLQQATERNMAGAMSLGASLQGHQSAGGALRGIQNQRAAISQQSAMDSGQLRMQEQMAARSQLGNLLAQGRGGDQQQTAMNDSLVKFYVGQGLDLDVAQMKARMEMEGMRSNASLGLATLNSGNDARNNQMLLNGISGAAQGLASYASSNIPKGSGNMGATPVGYDNAGSPIYSMPNEWQDYPTASTPPPLPSDGGGML